MKSVSKSIVIAACVFGSLLPSISVPAYAQTQPAATGTVTGVVNDPDNAIIPGAAVTLTPAAGGGEERKATSGSDGAYTFSGVPAGTYNVTVSMAGFSTFVRQGVRVGSTTVTVVVKMIVGTEEQINVTTDTNQLTVDPSTNASASVLKDKDLDALSDDPDELADELAALAGPAAGPNGGQIYVDGFTGGQLPPKSSIREIRVNQNPFSAQYDRQGFGRVEVFTKPGTDKLRGQLSVQGNAKAFNTSSPFLGASNTQPDYHRLFFIGSLTGALTKKSSYSLGGSSRTIQDNAVFAGQIISTGPTSNVLCAPGNAACSLNTYPDQFRAVFHPQNRWDFTPRYDVAITDKNTLTVRYQVEHGDAQNNSLGSTGLPTVATNSSSTEHQITFSDTQILSSHVINETRLQLRREKSNSTAVSTAPTLTLQGFFTGGGSSSGTSSTTSDHMELQNYTSVQLQRNFVRFGMRLRVDRQALFSNAGSNGTFSYSSAANYIANQPFQYTVVKVANPRISGNIFDVGFYAEDDWRVKPNLTFSYGIRYEAQDRIHSVADIAPRVSVTYGVPTKTGNPKTVLRAGFGVFYDRFGLGNVINTYRQNGTNQVTQIFRTPGVGCSPSNVALCGSGATASNTIYTLGADLRTPYNLQTAIGIDHQFSPKLTLSLNYQGTLGVHEYFQRSIPVSATNLNYQYQSGGVLRQNQFILNFRTQVSNKLSLSGFYAFSSAKTNANGGFVTDSLNPATDYGRSFQPQHRVTLFGNYSAPFGISASPFLIVTSGSPYNITTGTDVNQDSIINDRASFAAGKTSGDCRNALDFATPALGTVNYARVPVGYCTGPNNVQVNLRLSKGFGFGKREGANNGVDGNTGFPGGPGGGGPGGPGGGGPGGGGPPGGGGGGGGFGAGPGAQSAGGGATTGGGRGGARNGGRGGARTSYKYNVNFGAQIQNLVNFIPYATPNGQLTSYSADPTKNRFGVSTSLAGFGGGGPGGGGGNSGSAVRTITLQMNFSF